MIFALHRYLWAVFWTWSKTNLKMQSDNISVLFSSARNDDFQGLFGLCISTLLWQLSVADSWHQGGRGSCLAGCQSLALVLFDFFLGYTLPLLKQSVVLLAICIFQAYSHVSLSANISGWSPSGTGSSITARSRPLHPIDDSGFQHCLAFISSKCYNNTYGIFLTAVFTHGTASPATASPRQETSTVFPTVISLPRSPKVMGPGAPPPAGERFLQRRRLVCGLPVLGIAVLQTLLACWTCAGSTARCWPGALALAFKNFSLHVYFLFFSFLFFCHSCVHFGCLLMLGRALGLYGSIAVIYGSIAVILTRKAGR